MTNRNCTALAAITCACAVSFAISARAGGDKVAFPESYAKGVLYTTLDRADNKQHRELYVSPEAIAAAKKGEALPSGTVITLIQFAAKLDEQGNPVKDANGRFVKDKLLAYNVMEKRTGWGAEYPDTMRNGEWEYQAFRPDKSVNAAAKVEACFNCHKPLGTKVDYLFSYHRME